MHLLDTSTPATAQPKFGTVFYEKLLILNHSSGSITEVALRTQLPEFKNLVIHPINEDIDDHAYMLRLPQPDTGTSAVLVIRPQTCAALYAYALAAEKRGLKLICVAVGDEVASGPLFYDFLQLCEVIRISDSDLALSELITGAIFKTRIVHINSRIPLTDPCTVPSLEIMVLARFIRSNFHRFQSADPVFSLNLQIVLGKLKNYRCGITKDGKFQDPVLEQAFEDDMHSLHNQ